MDLLHYVERDGDDAAGVLAHSNTPGRARLGDEKDTLMATEGRELGRLNEGRWSAVWTDPGHVWLGSNRVSSVGS